jgi:hypothetical protein
LTKGEVIVTEDQYKTLCARVYVDKQFRDDLLADPVKAAGRLGISLTQPEADTIKAGAAQIRKSGEEADKAHAAGKVRPLLIPIPALQPVKK